jgi:tetratricopeptide (TPR) repeat protein
VGAAAADATRPPAPQEIELPPDAPSGQPHAPLELARLLREGNVAAALDIVEASGKEIPTLTLSAGGWLNLGKAGAQHRRFKPALVAFRRAIDVAPDGPLAPQAWLLAARLYDEEMNNREQSDRLLGELARRFPGSQEGQFAARRLATPKAG